MKELSPNIVNVKIEYSEVLGLLLSCILIVRRSKLKHFNCYHKNC